MNKRKVTILGATGTIGQNTLELIEAHQDKFTLVAVTAGENANKLAEIIVKHKPQYAAILKCNEADEQKLRSVAKEHNVNLAIGEQAIIFICQINTDIAISAIVGISALYPTYEIIKHCKYLGLANKESIICAGKLFIEHAEKHKVKILPIDSEHNSLFQMLDNLDKTSIPSKITITASGGPFLHIPLEEFKNITPEMAVKHPNWHMGSKISVDSATMANKGLELIEAYFLFKFPAEKIEAIIHPESIIHAIVDFIDCSSLSVLYHPHMKIPIAHALGYPERINSHMRPLDLTATQTMSFYDVDYIRFPMFRIAKQVLESGEQSSMIAYNCANEYAVSEFLSGTIKFTDIVKLVETVLNKTTPQNINCIADVFHYKEELEAKIFNYCIPILSSPNPSKRLPSV